MAATTTMVHVRVDEQIKAQATETLAAMGLTVSDAVRVFLTRVVTDQAFPFELKAPNAQSIKAMAEAQDIIASRQARFESADALINCPDLRSASWASEQFTTKKNTRSRGRHLEHNVPLDAGDDSPLGRAT